MEKLSSCLLRNDVSNVKWSKPPSLLMKSINNINYILSGQLWLFYTSYYRFSIPCHLILAELNLFLIDLISFGTWSARPSRIIMTWMVGGTMEPMCRIEPRSPCGDGDGKMKALYCENWLIAVLMLFHSLSVYPPISQCSPWFHLVGNIESHWPCPESSPSKCPDRFRLMHHPSENVLNCSCQDGLEWGDRHTHTLTWVTFSVQRLPYTRDENKHAPANFEPSVF